jgi:hypothetical protein
VARWEVPETTLEVRATSRSDARVAAVREVHRRLEIPGWRPWMRTSYLRTAAEPVADADAGAKKARAA